MAVNIDTFMGYVQTAKKGPSGEKSVVRISGGNELTSNVWQTLGWRKSDFKNGNLETRSRFLAAVVNEFGGIDKLPAGVKKALNLDAFELKNGEVTSKRPLTARRIEKVSAAIKAAREARSTETVVADAVVSRVLELLKNNSVSEEQKQILAEKFGKKPAAIRKAFSELAKTNQTLKACLSYNTMSKIQMDEFKSIIKRATQKTFEEAMKKDVQLDGANPNDKIFTKLSPPVPEDDANREAIMRMIASQMGHEGLWGDLKDNEFLHKDYGFGKMVDLMVGFDDNGDNLGFTAGTFVPLPENAGFRDVSREGNSIVITQQTHFGPQMRELDDVKLAMENAGIDPIDVPVYNVTKTIRIPLDQPKVEPGGLPEYTCEVEVSPFAEEAFKKRLQNSPCGFGKPLTLTLEDEGDYLRETIMTHSTLTDPSLESLEFNNDVPENENAAYSQIATNFTRLWDFTFDGMIRSYDANVKNDAELVSALKGFFVTKNPQTEEENTDWRSLKLFNKILVNGLDVPDEGRELMGTTQTFPYTFAPSRMEGSRNTGSLTKLDNGHYAVTFSRKIVGPRNYAKTNERNSYELPVVYTANEGASKDDFYEYSCSYEFYVDENNKAHVSLLEDPQVTWMLGTHFAKDEG